MGLLANADECDSVEARAPPVPAVRWYADVTYRNDLEERRPSSA